jgi:hypothetical protein
MWSGHRELLDHLRWGVGGRILRAAAATRSASLVAIPAGRLKSPSNPAALAWVAATSPTCPTRWENPNGHPAAWAYSIRTVQSPSRVGCCH